MGAKPQKRRKGETRSGAPSDRHINTQLMRNNYKEGGNFAAYIKKKRNMRAALHYKPLFCCKEND